MEEISNLTERLAEAEAEPAIQASESFHQSVVRRLRTEAPGSFSPTVVARLRAMLLNWRVVLPVIGAAAAVIAVFSVFEPRPGVHLPATSGVQVVLTPGVKKDLEPTLSNYQLVANRSLEELDELLTRQGNRNPPPTPLYTASTLARANGSD
jgi:hypothetical protein